MKPILIKDARLTPNLNRVRNGKTQEFTKPGNRGCGPDFKITPPSREFYAELIEGQWYWVNGCAECNGKPRDWSTYIECEKHDVCRTCGIKRSELVDPPWGGKNGWQCQSCAKAESDAEKAEALQRVASQEYNELDYWGNDNVVCPHCGSSYEVDDEPGDEETCEVCGGSYSVEVEYTVTYSTKVIGERILE